MNTKPKQKIPSNSIYLLLRFSWANSENVIQLLPILNYKVPCNKVKMICGVSGSTVFLTVFLDTKKYRIPAFPNLKILFTEFSLLSG